jgi:hypothetical protein
MHQVKTLRSQDRGQLPARARALHKTAQTIRKRLIDYGYARQCAGFSVESATRRRGDMDTVARRQPSGQADDVGGVTTAIPVVKIGK